MGEADDRILEKLRRRGCSKLESVSAFHDAGLPLIEAKRLVHQSPPWRDPRHHDNHIFDELDEIEPEVRPQ